MKIAAIAAAAGAVFLSAEVWADGPTIGKYDGSYTMPSHRGPRPRGLTIVIESVEGGLVKGVATRHEDKCRGDYPVQGKMDGNKLQLRATEKGGPAGDCGFSANMTVEGNKMVGTMGDGSPVQVSK